MEAGVFMINLLQLLLLELFQLWNGAGSHRIHFNGFLLHCCDQKKKNSSCITFLHLLCDCNDKSHKGVVSLQLPRVL